VRVWDRQAENWVRWARTPGHDAYWQFRDTFFDAIVPPPGRRTLEVGCGEGRVSRDLAARGHRVTGVDASGTLVEHARAADPAGWYVVADAAALPFADRSFDLVVAYNSLMDVDDMPAAVAEAARVLAPGGRLCICVTHPINDAGVFVSAERDAEFVISGSYFGRRPFELHVDRDGLEMHFSGWCYALEDYARALEAAGLVIERLREPPAPSMPGAPAGRLRYERLPNFLHLRCRRG
jgi:SAM-dependent methyltransferase